MTRPAATTGQAENNPAPVLATVIAMPAGDVESPHQYNKGQQPLAIISPAYVDKNGDDDGKGLGIAMFVLLLVGFIFNFILPPVSFVCCVATIVISSILTCGCCCASEYNMRPNVKKFAKATLVSLCLMFFVQIFGIFAVIGAMSSEADEKGVVSESTAKGAGAGIVVVLAFSVILNIMAIVFSALFTWARGCGSQQPINATVI